MRFEKIVILTGAGLSAESGLGTFRDKGGLWSEFNIEEVATPEGFSRNPVKVHDFYNLRRRRHADAKPNAAHHALAKLERSYKGEVLTVTQNIDALHEAAGTKNLIHMHGELGKALCAHCWSSFPWLGDLSIETPCPACGLAAMRPDVVWFGEMPREMDRIYEALGACDLFISIGTSGAVYPAAGFGAEARAAGAHTVELNLEPSDGASYFAEAFYGPATEVVPAFVDRLLTC
ncbi:MAG: NAD-dependent deacylase [Actinomycetota bacterium]